MWIMILTVKRNKQKKRYYYILSQYYDKIYLKQPFSWQNKEMVGVKHNAFMVELIHMLIRYLLFAVATQELNTFIHVEVFLLA